MSLFVRMRELCVGWELCRTEMLVAIAETHGTHTEDDVLAMILGGRLKFWPAGASGLVTEFTEYPQMKVLNVFLCGGSLEDLLSTHTEVEAYAKANGCKRMTMGGRPGWERVLPKAMDGCRIGGTFMYKDL